MRFDDFVASWIEHAPLKESTRYGYRRVIELHLSREFGGLLLRDISYSRVRAWHTGLRKAGLSPTTVDRVNNVLRSCLNAAVRDELLRSNPAAGHRMGVSRTRPLVVPTPKQVMQIDALMPRALAGLVTFAAYTGVRFSEQAALRVGDLDPRTGSISVRRAVTHPGGREVVDTPKTPGARRSIPLATPALGVANARSLRRGPEEILFPSATGGHLRSTNVSRVFRRQAAAAGHPDLRWHDLRHTFGSWLAASNQPVTTVMALMGHSQLSTVQRYLHSTDDLCRAAVAALEAHELQ